MMRTICRFEMSLIESVHSFFCSRLLVEAEAVKNDRGFFTYTGGYRFYKLVDKNKN